jgi:hypothetical protein
MSELKPCPFCGSEAEFDRKGTSKVSCIIRCTDCGCTLETGETWASGQSWNTRTQSQWISVEGGNWPEEIQGNKVIGRNGDNVFDCEFDDGFWCNIGGESMTHWMKLDPLPPKEQGQ